MNWLNYHHLYYFYVISREGSISKAAAKLRVGQPALSSQLKSLEDHMGSPLFERRNRGLHLTEQGKVAFNYAKEIFRLGTEMLDTLHDRPRASKYQIQVGILDNIPKEVAGKLVESAWKVKNSFVSLYEGHSDELMRQLAAHEVDLSLTQAPAPPSGEAKFTSKEVGDLPVLVCGSPKFENLKNEFPQSLADQSFFLPTSHSPLRRDLEHYFETISVQPHFVGEAQDSEVQKQMALLGKALICVPQITVSEELRTGRLIKIGTIPFVRLKIWLTATKRRISNPVVDYLLENFKI